MTDNLPSGLCEMLYPQLGLAAELIAALRSMTAPMREY